MELNNIQSTLEELQVNKEVEEIRDQFYDAINNIPYIRTLISSKRLHAKDLPKDSEGKIIIDITKPHILEDMDYFRPSAIYYQQHKKFTNLRPNPAPNSEYGKWIREEVRRCYEGYIRESDGEWITGDMYFFLNYCPIQLVKKDSKGKSLRVIDFPKVWEGHYYKFHYLNQCRNSGKHAMELASRGKGKSYCGAALLAKRFILGESREVSKKVQCVATASEKKYIQGANQLLDMFQYYIDFNANNTQFPSRRLTSTLNNLQWTMGYIDVDSGTRRGSENSVIGITSKDDESKLRGSRGVLYLLEEAGAFPRLLNLYSVLRPSVEDGDNVWGLIFGYGCLTENNKVWTLDGRNIPIKELKREDGIVGCTNYGITRETIGSIIEPVYKDCIKITLNNGNYIECSTDHPILKQEYHNLRIGRKRKENIEGYRKRVSIEGFTRADLLKVGDRVCEAREISIFGSTTLFDARLIGMLIGDGSYGFDNTPVFSSENIELLSYVKDSYSTSLNHTHITKLGRQYEEIRIKGICKQLRNIGIYGQTKLQKRLPSDYQTLTKECTKELLAGLYDTDGHISNNGVLSKIILTQSNKEILEQVKLLLRKFGITANIQKVNPIIKATRKDRNPYYKLVVSGSINIINFYNNIPLLIEYKRKSLADIYHIASTRAKAPLYNDSLFIISKISNIEYIGKQIVYNLSAMGSHTYLGNNIITHNTAGDSDSDFSSMQELMYNPIGYNILGVPNVYDKEGQGRSLFTYFFPGYINRAECYDNNGNSDVTKAVLEILKDRYIVKYNSSDINAITKRIAEIPITPQEAILRTRGNMFPVTQLNERLNQIDSNPSEFDDVYIGNLVLTKTGQVEYKPSNDKPIHDFPLQDNKAKGAIEIFKLPEKDSNGKVFSNRYIMGLDPVDDDTSGTVSLTSNYVLDLWTDTIVAEYTGRQDFADDNYEITRLLCLFYNAKCLYENNKKGIFAYMQRMNCLYLLADAPDYLKDKDMIKYSLIGNKSKGVNATAPINNYANLLIRNWLLQPVTSIQIIDGVETEVTIPNLFKIRSRALLKELILFNPDINVDRIRALGMLMLYREEFMINTQGSLKTAQDNGSDLANDKFFLDNYDNRLYNRNSKWV